MTDSKRREVTLFTYKKWMTDLDKPCKTITWLDCDTCLIDGKRVVTKLKCKVCNKLKSKIIEKKHFSDKWIEGADSLRTGNIRDHADSD